MGDKISRNLQEIAKIIEIQVWPDYVIISGETVARPSRISRSQWMKFWDAIA